MGIYIYKNGSLVYTVTGLENYALTSSSVMFPAVWIRQAGDQITANFGQRPFTYTPPTGFVALNTYNLQDSTIVKGNKVMEAAREAGAATAKQVAPPPAAPKEAVLQSMPGGGKCLYYLLAAVEAVKKGTPAAEVQHEEANMQEAKQRILQHAMALRDCMANQTEAGKNSNYVEEEWLKLVGESAQECMTKVFARERLGPKEKWGGHAEAAMYGWRADTQLFIVDAGALKPGESAEEMSKQVHGATLPYDDRNQIY